MSIIIIRNSYDIHFPVLKRQHIIRGNNNNHKTLIIPAAKYETQCWVLTKDIAERLDNFDGNMFKRNIWY